MARCLSVNVYNRFCLSTFSVAFGVMHFLGLRNNGCGTGTRFGSVVVVGVGGSVSLALTLLLVVKVLVVLHGCRLHRCYSGASS